MSYSICYTIVTKAVFCCYNQVNSMYYRPPVSIDVKRGSRRCATTYTIIELIISTAKVRT